MFCHMPDFIWLCYSSSTLAKCSIMLTSKNLWRDGRQDDPGASTPFFVLNLGAPYEKSFYKYVVSIFQTWIVS